MRDDITGWTQSERRLSTQYAVSCALVEAATLDDAAAGVMQAIGRGFGWELGTLWCVDEGAGVLRSHRVWPPSSAEEFLSSSRETTFSPGVGLPGRVWESGQPAWIADVRQDRNFPRAAAAARHGLHAAFAFPIQAGQGILGVMEFFSREIRPPDEELLQTVTTLGNQIGQFIEKKRAEEQLQQNEMRMSATIASALDAIISMDHEGKIVDFNPAAESIFGYSRADVIGRPLEETIIPPSLRRRHHSSLSRYLATGKAHILGERIETTGLRADGSQFPVELTITRIPTAGPPMFTGYIRDITERVQAYQLLERRVDERTRELSTLLAVSDTVASTLDLQVLLGLVIDQLRAIVDYGSAAISIYQDGNLVVSDYRGPLPADLILQRPDPMQHPGMTREGLGKREPIIIPHVRQDGPTMRRLRGELGERFEPVVQTLGSWIGVPLITKDRVIGMLSLAHPQPDHFTPEHTRLILAVADQAAIAIENATLHRQAQELAALEERQRLARELHDSVVQAFFGIALSARTAHTLIERDRARAVQSLEVVLSLARAGMAEMRSLIFELRPESLETEGLVTALQNRATAFSARGEIPIHSHLCVEPAAPIEVKEAIYRIAQEALHNALKHAQARALELRLESADGEITLEIRDDGIGFDLTGIFPGHLGLHSMRERAQLLGGSLEIKAGSAGGTSVQARIPYLLPV